NDDYGQIDVPAGLKNVIAISAGGFHSLALKRDGTVWAWGDNGVGQTDVPVDLTNAIAISAGNAFSLALRKDGTVVGWGWNNANQISVPAGLSNVVAISAGWYHSLAVTQVVHYVNLSNAAPIAPYVTWSTAAENIQDAIDAASPGDAVLVTNGIYQGGRVAIGGTLTNQVAIDKAITVKSVNGPASTVIHGEHGLIYARCAYLADG